jgi:hypothetical protein
MLERLCHAREEYGVEMRKRLEELGGGRSRVPPGLSSIPSPVKSSVRLCR